ncbi:hypothetical protein ACFSCX_24430 [Bacillus salitolerans]|uniref:L-lactate permease n=1 Tax=Bacillus salitolerans TaxID=1437434 RepID=A0ABW4LXP7_9BACI
MTVLVMLPAFIPVLLGLAGYFISKKIQVGLLVSIVSGIPVFLTYDHLKSIWTLLLALLLMWMVICLFMNFKARK